ncbi:MAG: hypothetical protein EpisKO_41330 [Epibacterium sp.]
MPQLKTSPKVSAVRNPRNAACRSCSDTGLVFVGTGHRMSSYPWAEKFATDACTDCARGRALNAPDDSVAREEKAQRQADDLMAERRA